MKTIAYWIDAYFYQTLRANEAVKKYMSARNEIADKDFEILQLNNRLKDYGIHYKPKTRGKIEG